MGNKNGVPALRDEDVEIFCKSSGMEPEEVREGFERFVVDYPDGKIDKSESAVLLKKVKSSKLL